MIFGKEAEHPRRYFCFDFNCFSWSVKGRHNGRLSWNPALVEGLPKEQRTGSWQLVTNAKFSIIDVANTRIIAVRAVIAPFYESIPGEWGDRFIVLSEIGALVFDQSARESNARASKRIRQYRPGDKHRCRHLCQAKIELPHHLLNLPPQFPIGHGARMVPSYLPRAIQQYERRRS